MKLAIDIEHQNPGYIDQRGGVALLSHLRGASDRVEHRRGAIDRACGLFEAAIDEGKPDPEAGGLGLLVMQRALLAAEDLGGLLHAFDGTDPWERLRTTKIPDLKAAFERGLDKPEAVLAKVFRLASEEQINEELASQEERQVLYRLRQLALQRWSGMLRRSAGLWLRLYNVAKATMHGYPLVAGAHIEGPPRAGEIADDIESPARRYAVAVTSRMVGREVITDRQIIALDREAVASYRRGGMTAARLTLELCDTQEEGIMTGHAAGVPLRGARFLDSESQAIAERFGAKRTEASERAA